MGGSIVVVTAPVEIDPVSGPAFDEALAAVSAESDLRVDCSVVEFMDSTGLRALVVARNRLVAAGGSLVVTSPSVAARRVLELGGLDELIDGHEDTGP
jgi:anti-sigma B factor antagonist